MKVSYRYIVFYTERMYEGVKQQFIHFVDTYNLTHEFDSLLSHLYYFKGQKIVKIETSSTRLSNW